jgi:hypothetical protein
MLEYTALAFGYRHLLLLAIAFYALSSALYHGPALFQSRRALAPAAA